MALKALTPVPKVPLTDMWDILATEAGRPNAGLTATVHLSNGQPQVCETITLGDPESRTKLAAVMAPKVGLDTAVVSESLLQLIAAVEGVLRQMDAQSQAKADNQATRLVTLATDADMQFFHTPDGEPYASMLVGNHHETWPLKVKAFRRMLARRFYDEEGKAPGGQAVQDALGVLEGKALYDGDEFPVYTRLAEHNGAIYLDLGNATWQAVELTASGWRVIDTPPVKFRRPKGMLPLPEPVRGGTLDTLRSFINVGSDADWRLLVAWLVATLHPTGPYPVLVVHGEQGSSKSTMGRVLRALVDPNKAALRTTPRDERDLVIAATNSWVIAFDNLGHLSKQLSDALCRLATGTGFATRELYTDAEEVIFEAQRPIVLNAIEELATEGDMLSRAIVLYLPSIPEDKRQDEETYWRSFASAQPLILGTLCDIISAALRQRPHTTLDRKPRMADFALWSCAAAEACGWTAQEFLDAYQGVREAVQDLTLEASPVGLLVRKFAYQRSPWDGTARELLAELEAMVHEGVATGGVTTQPPQAGQGVTMQAPKAGSDVTKDKTWPKNGQVLSNTLRRLAPTLRALGIDVTFDRDPDQQRTRIIRLRSLTLQTPQGTQRSGADSEPEERERERF